ncbi:MAG: GNAT family N-acetyltransferase [Nitrospirales bacterium]
MMGDALSVFIRPGTLQDLEFLVGSNAALAWETERRQLDLSSLRSGVLALLQDPHKGWYIVAEATSQAGSSIVVGQLLVTFEWSDWRNKNFWWLQSVYVHPDYRRKGVFTQLYAYVMKEAKNRNEEVCGLRLYVEQDNTIAHQSYDHLGFQKAPYHIYACEWTDSAPHTNRMSRLEEPS